MTRQKSRIEARTRAMLRARLRWNGGEREAIIIDASSRGLLAMMAQPPGRGEYVELMVGQHRLVGQVRWCVGKRVGLSFRERISVTALLEGIPEQSLMLSGTAAGRRSRAGWLAALTADSSMSARLMQFAAVVVLVAAAAWGLANLASGSLGAIETARSAMETRS